jgi:Trk K+ transport system NAD-binding subunit
MVRRGDDSFDPTGQTRLEYGDHLTFIGEPDAIQSVYEQFVEHPPEQ